MSAPEPRVALVTGGGGGIGRAVGAVLAGDGFAVALIDRDRAAAEAAAAAIGGGAAAFVADVRDRGAVEAAVAGVYARHGRIDALVHSAGVLRTARLLQLSEEEWDDVFDTNAKGRFLVSQAVARVMIEQGGGVIVDVGSLSAERVPPGRLHYCVSNGTADALMRAMAVDLGKYGIRVLSIIAGPVETPMIGGRADDSKRLEAFAQMIPLRRIAQPADIAAATRFLVSGAARYMTGSKIHVDGGWTAG